jgi:hypothetical protein
MSEETINTALRGYLVVFVDGYKVRFANTVHIFSDGEKRVSVPDRLLPAVQHEIDSRLWWEDGWAVGENSRDRLCGRFGGKTLKQFNDFDDAVAFVYRRRQKFKSHQHTLVYVVKDHSGRGQMHVVRSLDEIEDVHLRLEKERQEKKHESESRDKQLNERYPWLNRLEKLYGRKKAWQLSMFLDEIKQKGKPAVMDTMAKSSWYRIKKELAAAEIVF